MERIIDCVPFRLIIPNEKDDAVNPELEMSVAMPSSERSTSRSASGCEANTSRLTMIGTADRNPSMSVTRAGRTPCLARNCL